jgi:dTDP-4-dehydrorhamnose reductase
MTITIVGAGSKTAQYLVPMIIEETDASVHLLSSQVVAVEHPRITSEVIDITDKQALKESVMAAMPTAIINLAAKTDVDKNETERSSAWSLHVSVVEHLVRLSRLTDAHLVQVSTDYVFDGKTGMYGETDTPSPINYYGKSKLAGENAITGSSISSSIVRTNVVYAATPSKPDFVQWLLKNFDADKKVQVVNDQFSNPTYAEDLAEAILICALERKRGLFHVGGADYLSRYEFACACAEIFMVPTSMITPVTTDKLQQSARRPLRGGLQTLKAQTQLQVTLHGIEAGLVSYKHRLFDKSDSPMV